MLENKKGAKAPFYVFGYYQLTISDRLSTIG